MTTRFLSENVIQENSSTHRLIEDVYKDDLELRVREQSHSVSRFFLPLIKRRRRRCFKSLLLWSRNFATMVTWRHTSPLYKHWYRLITVAPRLRSLKRGLVISRFFSIHYTVTGAENFVRYIEDFLYIGSLYRGSTAPWREREIGLIEQNGSQLIPCYFEK